MEEQIRLLQSVAQTKGIHISNQIPSEAQLSADKNHLDIIIRNLLQNALKFTNSGGTIGVSFTENKGVSQLTIQDSGIGMGPELLHRLFRVDNRTSRAGTAHEQGTGLGLVLVKELAEANRGQITVESQVGKGTTFTLSFAQEEAATRQLDTNIHNTTE